MDPLSITASVVALIGAGNQIAIGINKLASLRGAPASILALNNELSDLRLVLSEAEILLAEHDTHDDRHTSKLSPLTAAKRFLPSFQLARNRLEELENIEKRLTTRTGRIDRLAWLLEQENISKAQKSLRASRIDIIAVLGLLSSKSSFRVETQLQEVQSLAVKGNAYISQSIDRHTETLRQILECQQRCDNHDKEEQVRASEKQLRPPIGAEEARGRRYSDSPGALFEGAQFSALRMRFLRRRKCDPWCSCRCHAHTRLRTPQLLQTIIGQLFVGYAGFPALTGSCDLPDTCNGTAQSFVQLNYYFPPWFLARFVTLSLRISDFQKPEYSLRMLNVRSKFEPIFIGAGRNDAALLRSLIHNGKASVLDVTNDDGHSALHLAVKQSNVDAAKALLELGAEPYLENAAQETPYDMAWSTILCFQDTPNAAGWRVEEMKALFPSLDSIEERRKFTKIHKIINRILHCDLETELCRSRDLINQVDADGRTALSYAAARGDHVAVNTLLRYGADPNIADRIGQRPLRQSMKAFDSTCTNLLLQAGANVNYRDNWEQTALISSVFYPQPLPFTTALLLAGTDVNAVDFQGSSALMEAVKCNAPEAVQLLLDHQADVNVIDHFGMNIFMQGVRHNSHAALEVLLDSDIHVVHSVCDSSQKTVLHWAAEVGDIKTLQILTRSPLKDLSVHDKTATGLTAIDVAEKRLHMEKLVFEKTPTDTEWLTAFRDLLETIRVPTANQSPISPSGKSDISDDIFHDALQHLTFEERSGLAEEGGVQRPV